MKIDHIAMYVTDLEAAREFFTKYLGALAGAPYHNVKTGFRSYFLSFDDGARLEIMNKPGMEDSEKTRNRTGFIHAAFSLGSREKVDELTRRLAGDRRRILRELHRGNRGKSDRADGVRLWCVRLCEAVVSGSD